MKTKKITLNELKKLVKQVIINESFNGGSPLSDFLNIINSDEYTGEGDHCIIKGYDKNNNKLYGEFDFFYNKMGDEAEGYETVENIPFEAKIIQEQSKEDFGGGSFSENKHYKLDIYIDGERLINLLRIKNKMDGGKTFRSIINEISNAVTHFIRTSTNNKKFKLEFY